MTFLDRSRSYWQYEIDRNINKRRILNSTRTSDRAAYSEKKPRDPRDRQFNRMPYLKDSQGRFVPLQRAKLVNFANGRTKRAEQVI